MSRKVQSSLSYLRLPKGWRQSRRMSSHGTNSTSKITAITTLCCDVCSLTTGWKVGGSGHHRTDSSQQWQAAAALEATAVSVRRSEPLHPHGGVPDGQKRGQCLFNHRQPPLCTPLVSVQRQFMILFCFRFIFCFVYFVVLVKQTDPPCYPMK